MALQLKTPKGTVIVGTLETILATAWASFTRDAAGNIIPEYVGESEVHWDSQETLEREGSTVYVDSAGDEWLLKDLVATEVADDDEDDEDEEEG